MSDLISRKVVMDWLRDLQAQAIINSHNGTLVDATIVAAVNNFIDFVVQVPTAFDVDKVVEELKRECVELMSKKFEEDKCNMFSKGSQAMYLKCVNIVKGAVKE